MLDEVDRGVVHALHLDGRAPFGRIAAALGVSTQTVVRRYHRLRREAGLRVVGLPAPDLTAGARWIVRLSAPPSTAGQLARSLARRDDTSWVRLCSGGTEIAAVVTVLERADTGGAPDRAPALLLHDLPRTGSVTDVSAHALLHTYLGGTSAWPGRVRSLSPEQQQHLAADPTPDPSPTPGPLDDGERRLLAVLARDGRAGLGELATATGWSPAAAGRRLAALRGRGAVFLDVELDDTALGIGMRALLWLTVPPREVAPTARRLAAHDELAFVATTTGAHNLVAQVLVPDPAGLHRYLTGPLAELDAVTSIETVPVLRTLKAL